MLAQITTSYLFICRVLWQEIWKSIFYCSIELAAAANTKHPNSCCMTHVHYITISYLKQYKTEPCILSKIAHMFSLDYLYSFKVAALRDVWNSCCMHVQSNSFKLLLQETVSIFCQWGVTWNMQISRSNFRKLTCNHLLERLILTYIHSSLQIIYSHRTTAYWHKTNCFSLIDLQNKP